MNGPEHYRAAERLLANRTDCTKDGTREADQIAAAQVHGTLALAAETGALLDTLHEALGEIRDELARIDAFLRMPGGAS